MDLGIKDRKAIVNGGSAGMGRGAVLSLALEGVELFVSARGEERLNKSCEQIAQQTDASITSIVADHSSDEGRERILAACPGPDILVGTCSPPAVTGDYHAIGDEDWERALEIALMSPVRSMKAVIPGMVERRWGRIVNIGTGVAKFPKQIRILSGAPRADTPTTSSSPTNNSPTPFTTRCFQISPCRFGRTGFISCGGSS